MSRITKTANCVTFVCPGCGDNHTVPVEATDRDWRWNGSLDRPTITPSILVRSGHYAPSWKEGDECWCGKDYGFSCYLCHSFVTDGRIQFLGDCTHKLAGQTVDLVEV